MDLRDTFAYLFDIGKDVLFAELDKVTKVIKVQLGDSTTGVTESSGTEWWQHTGFASMPAAPTNGGASCQTVTIKRSDHDVVIASRDTRSSTMYGSLAAGETCVYSTSGQGRALFKADGSINLYTTQNNQAGGTGMAMQITPSGDSISLVNGSGYGIVINDAGVKITAKNSALALNADGSWTLVGTASGQIDGGNILLGTTATPATPVLVGPTGMAGVASTKIFGSIA